MKKIVVTIAVLLSFGITRADSDDGFCAIKNTAFKNGENVSFYIFYTVAGLWVHAGTAQLLTQLETYSNKPVWHFTAVGKTNSSYDWIFKVRDNYQSYVDTTTMMPLKFLRSVEEGGYKHYENVTYNRNANTVVNKDGVFKVTPCIQDVISAVYYARNINFDQYKVGDKVNLEIFLDNEVYPIYIRYLGKETIKSRYGKFKCIKFKPLLIKSSVFEGGEKMTVWVSDDQNGLPIRIESGISVGSIKVDMMMYQNLRYPLTSLISIR